MSHSVFGSCTRTCYSCAEAFNQCAASCLEERDVKMMVRCIALDIDCAHACDIAAAAMSRERESAKAFCTLSAQVCNLCAQECERHLHTEHCRQRAQECRNMVA